MSSGPCVFSPDRLYRYRLDRRVHMPLDGDDLRIAFVLLNPSTADEDQDDPTIRRCIGFARRWSYTELTIVNLFGLRSTDPRGLQGVEDPVGPDNDRHILEACSEADLVVLAYGAHGAYRGRSGELRALLAELNVELYALGLTAAGEPRHPLYLRGDVEPFRFR